MNYSKKRDKWAREQRRKTEWETEEWETGWWGEKSASLIWQRRSFIETDSLFCLAGHTSLSISCSFALHLSPFLSLHLLCLRLISSTVFLSTLSLFGRIYLWIRAMSDLNFQTGSNTVTSSLCSVSTRGGNHYLRPDTKRYRYLEWWYNLYHDSWNCCDICVLQLNFMIYVPGLVGRCDPTSPPDFSFLF